MLHVDRDKSPHTVLVRQLGFRTRFTIRALQAALKRVGCTNVTLRENGDLINGCFMLDRAHCAVAFERTGPPSRSGSYLVRFFWEPW